jgi:ABC-type Fe3+ transport system permease subunit
MEEAQLDSRGVDHGTEWRVAILALILVGAAAAVALVVVGVNLLSDVNGPECHGEFPVCTTPTQESARQTFALLCGVGVLSYLVAAPPAIKAGRFKWPHLIIGVVIALAVLALVTDPVSHLRSEGGSDQWFVADWPL